MKSFFLNFLILGMAFSSCKNNKKMVAETNSSKVVANQKPQLTETTKVADQPTREEKATVSEDTEIYKPKVAEDVYFYMELTPCFGKCPVYKLTIKKSGQALLEGRKFFDYIGIFESKFTEDEMVQIENWATEVGYWEMNHVYNAPVTDLPSTTTLLRNDSQEQWVFSRMDAPDQLVLFHRNVETLLKDKQWMEIKE